MPVIGVSEVATTGGIWRTNSKSPLSSGGLRTGNLALSNDIAKLLNQAPTP